MESNELITLIKTSTFVALRNIASYQLSDSRLSSDEAYFELATLPTSFVKSICDSQNSDIWKHIAIPESKLPLAFMTIKAIVEKEDSQVQSAVKFASFIASPMMAKAKEELMDSNEDKAAKFIAHNGRSIALPIFEELIRQGADLQEIKSAIYSFYFASFDIENPKKKDISAFEDQCETQDLKDAAKKFAKEGLDEATKVAKELSGKAKGFFKDLMG